MDLTSLKKAFSLANVQQQRAFISICALLIKKLFFKLLIKNPMQIKEPVAQLSLLFRDTFNGTRSPLWNEFLLGVDTQP